MATLIPDALFSPVLYSECLTYTLFNVDHSTDVDFTVDLLNVAMPGMGSAQGIWTAADVQQLVRNLMLRPSDTHGRLSRDPGLYVVHLGSTPGTRIGIINLTRRNSQFPPDFGFVLAPAYQRKGYGSEAAERIMRYWRDEFRVKEICAMTTSENVASQKLLTKVGLQENGYVHSSGEKLLAFTLPGMPKMEGQSFSFFGETPEEQMQPENR